MATLSTAARNAACNAIVDLLDVGNEAARFLLTDTADGVGTTIAAISLDATAAFGAASTGVATLDVSPVPSATASATDTAAGWALQSMNSGTPTSVITGTIGTGSEDLDIDNASITSGQTINITSMTVTVPAAPP
jgi:hypothetical protein